LPQSYKLGVDVGGTFTDINLLDQVTGEIFNHKVPSTPKAPSQAVIQGVGELLQRIEAAPSSVGDFVHGTTIALNSVIQRKGARVALVVSRGNRDVLEIARLGKPNIFDLHSTLPDPLVPRGLVFETDGRVTPKGVVEETVSPEMEANEWAGLTQAGVESVAVCLLHAYANPANERALEAQLAQSNPELPVSLSSRLWPEIREYERASVSVLNAYVQPLMSRYLVALGEEAAGIGMTSKIYLTRSNGGVMAAEEAAQEPVHTLLSGPAAGVVGAAHVSDYAQTGDAIALDIGGTSAEVSVIRGGEPSHSSEAAVGDFPCILPSVDVFSVGAGGGSIAWFDEFGMLKVGPQSAGAEPGPACYGHGGTEPTVTDAYLTCGFLNPDNFIGGSMKLHPDRAQAAIGEIAGKLGFSTEDAADAVIRITTSNMSTHLLPLLTKRGIDPRDFSLIAYGGAGATHACFLADEVNIPRIIVPPSPGTLCALGAAVADLKSDHIRTFRRPLSDVNDSEIADAFGVLEKAGSDWLERQGSKVEATEVRRSADVRYRGQAFDIEVQLGDSDKNAAGVTRQFHQTYETLYKRSDPNQPAELINLRLRMIGKVPKPALPELPASDGGQAPEPVSSRPVYLGGGWCEASVFDRATLRPGQCIPGPAIIEQFDTTTVVAPDYSAEVNAHGLLILTKKVIV
jgi:N-methylhydantoinase A